MVDKARGWVRAGGHKYRVPAVAVAAGNNRGGPCGTLSAVQLHHGGFALGEGGIAIGAEHLLNDVANKAVARSEAS